MVGSESAGVISPAQIYPLLDSAAAEWGSIHLDTLQFWHRDEARLALLGLLALTLLLLATRALLARRRQRIFVPAILKTMPRSPLAGMLHVPLILFLLGLPFFFLALADPYSTLLAREMSYPGRRICIMVDASSSMSTHFTANSLKQRASGDTAFFTTVAAAERFVQMRVSGRFHDLLALVEFGNEAYVVTPFTHDYDNILLSLSLIGDPLEFSLFPDQGTIIARAVEEGTALFKAFQFLDAAGNLMVIFSDGEDSMTRGGNSLDSIVNSAYLAKIPVYLVRVNYGLTKGQVIPDALWIPAVEKTGGKFFAANNEKALLDAIAEIDKAATGTISSRQYSNQQPLFNAFALIAAMLWSVAAALQLGLRHFRKFP
ncbi:MAG: vWA domain-containing protein [Rugosibacter sp.]